MWAVAFGEIFDAIDFFGPFEEFEDAEVWAGSLVQNHSWWIVQLNPPT